MYPYGNEAGDREITSFDKCTRVNIPNGGMMFFERRQRKLHVRVVAHNSVLTVDTIIFRGEYNNSAL